MAPKPEPHSAHSECDLTARASIYEEFRTYTDGVCVFIVKNTYYEVTDLTWFCDEHCVDVETPETYEWEV